MVSVSNLEQLKPCSLLRGKDLMEFLDEVNDDKERVGAFLRITEDAGNYGDLIILFAKMVRYDLPENKNIIEDGLEGFYKAVQRFYNHYDERERDDKLFLAVTLHWLFLHTYVQNVYLCENADQVFNVKANILAAAEEKNNPKYETFKDIEYDIYLQIEQNKIVCHNPIFFRITPEFLNEVIDNLKESYSVPVFDEDIKTHKYGPRKVR